ncbi:MAG: hypothetical protein WBF90_21085 [Rivularia sp. (in: cyanobacteria)]
MMMISEDIERKNLNNGDRLPSKRQLSGYMKFLTVDNFGKLMVALFTNIQCKNAEGCDVKAEFLPITFTSQPFTFFRRE